MAGQLPVLLAQGETALMILGAVVFIFFAFVFAMLVFLYGGIWFQAYMSNANVSLWSLVGMSLR